MEAQKNVDWLDLLMAAVAAPQDLFEAHRFFHKYSISNRWLAAVQLHRLGLPLMPINTFKGWLDAKRPVQKGQKASISLVMPVMVPKDKDAPKDEQQMVQIFLLRRNWFHLEQTDGEPYSAPAVEHQDWTFENLLDALEIEEEKFRFDGVDPSKASYAKLRKIGINPLDSNPGFSRLLQVSRIVLGHTSLLEKELKAVPEDAEHRDLEAIASAYLASASLGLPDTDIGKVMLDDMLYRVGEKSVSAKIAKRAFSAADKLINAGY